MIATRGFCIFCVPNSPIGNIALLTVFHLTGLPFLSQQCEYGQSKDHTRAGVLQGLLHVTS